MHNMLSAEQIVEKLKIARLQCGLTQSQLGNLSGVSLPTIQNIEGNRANPSLDVLLRLFDALKLTISIEFHQVNWDLLCHLGLPLQSNKKISSSLAATDLIEHLRFALEARDIDERKQEALHALLFALKFHFSTFFDAKIAPLVPSSFLPKQLSGRVIKLKRLAVARLAEYL